MNLAAEHVARWLTGLNQMRFSREAEAEAADRLAKWPLMLLKRFPSSWMFSGSSLEHVAAKAGRVDDYRDVTNALGDWCRENRDKAPALPAPQVDTRTRAEADADAADRQFWQARVDRIRALPHATLRWRDAMGAMWVLNQGTAHPRPWAIALVSEVIAEADADGADTNPARVNMPVPGVLAILQRGRAEMNAPRDPMRAPPTEREAVDA